MSKPRLSINLFAGLASSFWAGLSGILIVPIYLHHLGQAQVGLIVFSTTLQGLFIILDLGFSTAINREVARASGLSGSVVPRDLIRTLEIVYWSISIVSGALLWVFAAPIAHAFLNSPSVGPDVTLSAMRAIALVVGLRLPAGLYTGVLMGSQRIVLVSMISIAWVTASNFGVLAVFAWRGASIVAFFGWQVAVSAVNIVVLAGLAWAAVGDGRQARFAPVELRRIWRFSTIIAVTTVLGALLMQLDKIVLARSATLEEVGRYGIAGLGARALLLLVAPVFGAIYPRMSELVARDDRESLMRLYQLGSKATALLLSIITAFVILDSDDIFLLWTRSSTIANAVHVVAPLLLIGSALSGIMYFPHAVQLAYGNARLPLWINVAMSVAFVPALLILVPTYGAIGAATAWLIANIVNFLFGAWLTHRALLPGYAGRWVGVDVMIPAAIGSGLMVLAANVVPRLDAPLARIAVDAAIAVLTLLISTLAVPSLRRATIAVVTSGLRTARA